MDYDVVKAAFQDELQKIAGSLQGHVRSGRRPLKASTLLQKEKDGGGEAARKKLAELTKLSGKGFDKAKTIGLLGVGAYGLHSAQKVKRRYDLGTQVEMQQKGY